MCNIIRELLQTRFLEVTNFKIAANAVSDKLSVFSVKSVTSSFNYGEIRVRKRFFYLMCV